ncbi:MAG: phosphotransferase [Bacteroidia bacterium]|nr:phosphotransferase [Bacteroidia bacterium]
MTRDEIDRLALNLPEGQGEVIETHISWVILSAERAWKAKRPVKLPFLDFSSLEDRQRYCGRELQLNQRLAPEVYLAVQPVRSEGKMLYIGPGNGKIVDYVVEMKRLDSRLEMVNQLRLGRVENAQMESLARILARFHQKAEVISHGETAARLIPLFNDLRSEENDIELLLGQEWHQRVEDMIARADQFLLRHEGLFYNRIRRGFVRDCHGDLHCGNIFLYPDPVIFDCIEFSDEFRQIDVLHEVAFLCMDLEARHYSDLANHFLTSWLAAFSPPDDFFHPQLFAFYKCYMANVRAKVTAMRRGSGNDEQVAAQVRTYLELMEGYSKDWIE